MRIASEHGATYWRQARLDDIAPTYVYLFAPLISKPIGAAIALAFVLALMRRRVPTHATSAMVPPLPAHEIATPLALLTLLAGALLPGVSIPGVVVQRYALPGVIGGGVALPIAAAPARTRRGAGDLLLCTALAATFLTTAYRHIVVDQVAYQDPVAARPVLLE